MKAIWIGFCYVWAIGIVVAVILLLRSDDTIQPTVTDFVVILAVALAPMLLPPVLRGLYRHLSAPAHRGSGTSDPDS